MRTIIDINRNIWANVKHFATLEKLTLNIAVQTLLENALSKFGYQPGQQGEHGYE